jgi:alkylation response protein AidB-like acyl-CoA dehydrogenase
MDLNLTEEQRAIIETADGLAGRHDSGSVSWEEAGAYPWGFMRDLGRHELTGIDIPEAQGGRGLSLLDSVLVMAAVAARSPHLADAVQASNFGAVRQVSAFGGERVIEEVLQPILAGRALATIGMSEPGAGSALASLRTSARRQGGDVVLNGEKLFNSNGPHATHVVAWARFSDEASGVGAVVVPADARGFAKGKTERFMSGETHCTLSFQDCRVPSEYVLLDHDGLRRMMSVFNIERLGNATRAYGYGEYALRLASRYLLERETGAGRLADHQGLQWKIADMRVSLESARLLLIQAATQLVAGVPDQLKTSMAKLAANEAGFNATNQALQIFGGYGYTEDSPLTYVFKRTRGWMIAGGTVEMQRNRIAREVLKSHRHGSARAQ